MRKEFYLKTLNNRRMGVYLVTNLRDDKFIGKKTDSRKHTIGDKRNGCDWINNGVDVSQPLQKLQSPIVAIPDRTMSAKQNFHWPKSPTEHLIKTIGKIDWCRTLETRSWWHAVDWLPSSCMHFKPSQNILRNWTIDPANLKQHKKGQS